MDIFFIIFISNTIEMSSDLIYNSKIFEQETWVESWLETDLFFLSGSPPMAETVPGSRAVLVLTCTVTLLPDTALDGMDANTPGKLISRVLVLAFLLFGRLDGGGENTATWSALVRVVGGLPTVMTVTTPSVWLHADLRSGMCIVELL